MNKAKCDLHQLIRKTTGPLDFKQFFPIFRDCILGLTFIHSKSVAHRDIKPQNIMMIHENKYVIADYGEGTNLSYECQYIKEVKF